MLALSHLAAAPLEAAEYAQVAPNSDFERKRIDRLRARRSCSAARARGDRRRAPPIGATCLLRVAEAVTRLGRVAARRGEHGGARAAAPAAPSRPAGPARTRSPTPGGG